MAIRLVLFDMDDVLGRYDRAGRIAGLARLAGRRAEAVKAALWDSGFEDAADRGAWDAGGYLAAFGRRLGYPLSRAEWVANRCAAMTPVSEVLELVKRVKAQADVALFTDNGPLIKEAFAEVAPDIARLFPPAVRVFSHELRALKSEPDSFLRLLQHRGISPFEAFFVDDKPANVEAARRVGIRAHRYRDFALFAATLHALGLA